MHMEKILSGLSFVSALWKHLHAHGENEPQFILDCYFKETPPCTWRKSDCRLREFGRLRNTSMHMEKIFRKRTFLSFCRKHLHAHGENLLPA